MLNLLGAGLQIAGSIFGGQEQRSAQKAANRQAARQAAASNRLARQQQRQALAFNTRQARLNRRAARQAGQRDRRFSRRAAATAYRRSISFARNQLNWLAQGARAAGLHPTAAIGQSPGYVGAAQAVQETPSFDSSRYPTRSYTYAEGQPVTGSVFGDGLMAASQAITGLQGGQLENELLRSQIEATRAQTRSLMAPGAITSALSRALQDDIFGDDRFLRRGPHPDAEAYQPRYEDAAVIFGLRNLLSDTYTGYKEWDRNWRAAGPRPSRIGQHFREYGIPETLAGYLNAAQPRGVRR